MVARPDKYIVKTSNGVEWYAQEEDGTIVIRRKSPAEEGNYTIAEIFGLNDAPKGHNRVFEGRGVSPRLENLAKGRIFRARKCGLKANFMLPINGTIKSVTPYIDPRENIAEQLMRSGFRDEEAWIVASLYQNNLQREIQDGQPVDVMSKNQAYFVRDKQGSLKVIKFVKKDDEADMESLVGFEFPKEKQLADLVKRSEIKDPINIPTSDGEVYITIQDAVEPKAQRPYHWKLARGNKQQLNEYIEGWMRKFAKIHVYGTRVMDRNGNYKKSVRVGKELDDERIMQAGLDIDWSLREGIKELGLEDEVGFIHGDPGLSNIIYDAEEDKEYLIDWGGSGRGPCMLDILLFLSNGYLQQRYGAVVKGDKGKGLDEFDFKRFISVYLDEKKSLQGIGESVTDREVEAAYCNMDLIRHQLYPKYAGIWQLNEGRGVIPFNERLARDMMLSRLAENGESARNSIEVVDHNGPCGVYETEDTIIYDLSSGNVAA